jgi:selenocysteine-specific elongation factor
MTIGGGRVVNAHPRRHRRFRPEVIAELEARLRGKPSDLLVQALTDGPAPLHDLARSLGLDDEIALEAAAGAIAEGSAVVLAASDNVTMQVLLFDASSYERVAHEVRRQLARFHANNPLRRGAPREELRSRTGFPPRQFDALVVRLAREGLVREDEDVLVAPNFEVRLSAEQQVTVERFLTALAADPFSPPAPDDYGIGRDLLAVLESRGDVIVVDAGIAYATSAFERMREDTLAAIDRDGSITLAGFRDRFGTSRKYAQAALEYFDDHRITRRAGDERVRGNG